MRLHPISTRHLADVYEFRRLPIGAKVWFEGEKQGYTVRASNAAFAVLTKPFNARKTVLYCIIDWESDLRGPENLLFGIGAETSQECAEMLQRVTMGDSALSSRHSAPLVITKYQRPKQSKDNGGPA